MASQCTCPSGISVLTCCARIGARIGSGRETNSRRMTVRIPLERVWGASGGLFTSVWIERNAWQRPWTLPCYHMWPAQAGPSTTNADNQTFPQGFAQADSASVLANDCFQSEFWPFNRQPSSSFVMPIVTKLRPQVERCSGNLDHLGVAQSGVGGEEVGLRHVSSALPAPSGRWWRRSSRRAANCGSRQERIAPQWGVGLQPASVGSRPSRVPELLGEDDHHRIACLAEENCA